MFRNGYPNVSVEKQYNQTHQIINYSEIPKYCVVAVIFSAFLINNKGIGKHDTLQKQNKWKNQNYWN